jgi:hypothetical protein
LSTFRANPPIVHVGHYGQPTVTHGIVDRNVITTKALHATTKDQQVPLKTLKALLALDKRDKRKAPSG